MKIRKFSIRHRDAFNAKEIIFSRNMNAIHSAANTTGKTTVMRALLYALGFPLPSSKPVRFEDFEFRLDVSLPGGLVSIKREAARLLLGDREYDLPAERRAATAALFGIGNPELLRNLMGAVYFDQESGWTMVNRGRVIGAVSFNVESFFRGLKGDESDESHRIEGRIRALDRKLREYKLMKDIAAYQEGVAVDMGGGLDYGGYRRELGSALLAKQERLKNLDREIALIADMMRKNAQFSDYIEKKKLYVKAGEGKQPIPVSKETLLDYRDVESVNSARKDILIAERSLLKRQIAEIETSQERQMTLDGLANPEEEMVKRLAGIQRISAVEVSKMIDRFKKEKKKLVDELVSRTKTDNPWVGEAHAIMRKYAEELGLPQEYFRNIFSKNKKGMSGAVLHKHVFICKLTYIALLSRKAGYPMPIFCDSPSGREVVPETVSALMNILRRDFPEHQLFISSINVYKDIFADANVCAVDGTLFNEPGLVDFL